MPKAAKERLVEVELELRSEGEFKPSDPFGQWRESAFENYAHRRGITFQGAFETAEGLMEPEAYHFLQIGMPALIQVGRCRQFEGALMSMDTDVDTDLDRDPKDPYRVKLIFAYVGATLRSASLVSQKGCKVWVKLRREKCRG